MAIGRISGQLLKDDLQRDGRNLSFDTNLLFLDVVNRRIGINNTSPTDALQVTGTARASNLTINTQADLASVRINTNTITSTTGTLNLNPNVANSVVVQAKLQVDNLELTGNNINALGTNKDINLNPTGTGKVVVGTVGTNKDVLINGNLHATGTITADGNLQLGDADTDNITFNAEFTSNIIPDVTETYNLGSSTKKWLNAYAKNLYTTTLNASTVVLTNGINLSLYQGKTWYVATNGGDTKSGQHQNDPFATVTKALSVAQAGDTIYIYPGTYTETFPMTVPAGVTVKGTGIRSVLIQPTAGTRNKDGFLITGEVTIEDLTLANFEYDSVNNTGYGFRLKTGYVVTSRSPYIRNITVITSGSTVRLGTNPVDDPRGFLAGDAGRGAYFSGSVASNTSKDVSVLFHSVTFITPGVTCITASNGVKIEWLNSFIYFADQGFYLPTNASSAGGQYGTAQVGLKILASNRVGTWSVGNTLTYYDTDGTTVLATGTIASISGDWVYITGYQTGFQTITDRTGKTVYAQGDAKLSTAQKKFGSASLALDGTGDYASVPTQPDFEFGTGNWTVELWAYRSVTGVVQTLFDYRPASGTYFQINLGSTGTTRFAVNGATIISGPTLASNTWTHIAVSKVSNVTKMFVNGTAVVTTYADTNNYGQATIYIGATNLGANGFGGYIDDLRITKGLGRYTTTFTAPTSALVGDIDTVLLLHFNGTNNSTTFTDDGVTKQDLRTSVGGTANLISYADYTKFGAEVRSIGSANVYGNYGFVGDGPGCIAYLISQNFAYVGSGRVATNDPTGQIPAQEVVKTNGAKIYYSSIDNVGNFKVGDYFSIDQKNGSVVFDGASFNVPSLTSIVFTDGVAVTEIDATKVQTGNILLSGNTISTLSGDLNLAASSGVVRINSTKSFVIPVGNTAARPSPAANGMIRYNTTENWFEGYSSGQWIPFGVVTDLTRTTSIQTDVTPGDQTLSFYANSTLAATLTDTAFTVNRVNVGNFDITSNTITPVTPNTDISIQPTGTGALRISNIKISTNTIENTTTNAVTTIKSNGDGYVKFSGVNGVVIPAGDNLTRPSNPVTGLIRYNTQLGTTELYDGTQWGGLSGQSGAITIGTAQDIAIAMVIILG